MTTVPITVHTWSGAHFLCCQILYRRIFLFAFFFYFLKEFYCKEIFWTVITTIPIIVQAWSDPHFIR